MSATSGRYVHFRLNLEQQRNRARELLQAAKGGNTEALARFRNQPPKLAEAQHLVALDLRFDTWAAMKAHIVAQSHQRILMASTGALDAETTTLHIRCGNDLRTALQEAGLHGDFHEHSYPYLIGPVREGEGCLEQRARFIIDSYAGDFDTALTYEGVLRSLQQDEQRLHDSATSHQRVVIWSEPDAYDQLVLVRLLGHYAAHRSPPHLELINVASYPGATRFLGLGQLPPEALRLLWEQRRPATLAQRSLGLATWKALTSEDPRALAAIMRSGTPELPLLAPALHRHLRELPALDSGLGFTQQMALEALNQRPASLNQLFQQITHAMDPLPGQGDFQVRDRLLPLTLGNDPLVTCQPGVDRDGRANPPWTDLLTITPTGQSVLRGQTDFRSHHPPRHWVGGVEIAADTQDWRWDEAHRDAICR